MPKTAVKKENENKTVETITEEVKTNETVVINENVEKKIEEALDKIDTTISKDSEIPVNTEKLDNVNEMINELKTEQKEFHEKIEKTPENSEEIIKDTLEKAKDLQSKLKELTDDMPTNKINNSAFTNFWNGVNYGF